MACILIALSVRPVAAQVPVEDNASIAMQLAQWAKNAGQMATQISQLANMVNLTTLMTTALGDSLGGGMAALLTEGRGAFAKSMGAYNSVMRVPATVDNELALLNPSTFADLTLQQKLERAERIRKMTQGTSAANAAASAKRAEQAMRRDQLQMKANELKWRSVGTLGALQALGEQASVANEFSRLSLETMEGIGNTIDLDLQDRMASREMAIQMARDDEQALRARIAQGAGRPTSDLATW